MKIAIDDAFTLLDHLLQHERGFIRAHGSSPGANVLYCNKELRAERRGGPLQTRMMLAGPLTLYPGVHDLYQHGYWGNISWQSFGALICGCQRQFKDHQ